MLIREARPSEIDDVGDLLLDAYGEYAALMPEPAWRFYAADIADVRGRLEQSKLLVAEDEEGLAGTVTFYPPESESPWPGPWAYMRLLAVAPARRGRGVGRALVEHVIGRARERGARGIGIHTAAWMSSAVGLYESLGFTRDGRFDIEPPGITMADGSPLSIRAYRLELAPGGGTA